MQFSDSRRPVTCKTRATLTSEIQIASLAVVMIVCLPTISSAQIQLDRFYPPVVRVNGETSVQAEGKFPTWPVEIVSDRDDVKVAAGTDSGQLIIQVKAEAAPGVVWLRMHDKSSASKLVPLLIEPIAATAEVEPNNKITEATPTELPAVFFGKLAKAGDVDTYRIQLKQGQTFVASVVAHRPLRSPMDAILQLVDGRGNVLLQTDDDRGLDPQLAYQVEEDRELFLRIFAFPEVANSTIGYSGAESFIYEIRLTTDAFVDHVLPLVVTADGADAATHAYGWNLSSKPDAIAQAAMNHSMRVSYLPAALGWQWQSIVANDAAIIHEVESDSIAVTSSLPCIFSGHIGARGEIDRVQFPVSAATRYVATVHSRAYGFPLDSFLRVINPVDGSEVATNDDASGAQYDASVTFTPKSDGDCILEVSNLVSGSGERHAYSVVIAASRPTAELTLAEDHFAFNAGESVEIPVSITRQSGFDDELTIATQGLPDGITATPVVSQAKGDSSKAVKLKITSNKASVFQGNFRIIATATAAEDTSSIDPLSAKYHLTETVATDSIWLTIAEAK